MKTCPPTGLASGHTCTPLSPSPESQTAWALGSLPVTCDRPRPGHSVLGLHRLLPAPQGSASGLHKGLVCPGPEPNPPSCAKSDGRPPPRGPQGSCSERLVCGYLLSVQLPVDCGPHGAGPQVGPHAGLQRVPEALVRHRRPDTARQKWGFQGLGLRGLCRPARAGQGEGAYSHPVQPRSRIHKDPARPSQPAVSAEAHAGHMCSAGWAWRNGTRKNVPGVTGLPPGLMGFRHRARWSPGSLQVSSRGQFSTPCWPQLLPGLLCTSLRLPAPPRPHCPWSKSRLGLGLCLLKARCRCLTYGD